MIDTIALNTEHESTRVVRQQVPAAPENAKLQWPWGMVSVLGLTVLAVIPFIR